MDLTDSTLLILLDKALHDVPGSFGENIDWDEVYLKAVNQGVAALGAKGLPNTIPLEKQKEWETCKIIQIAAFVRYLYAQNNLCTLLKNNGIPMAIIKGAAAAMLYPQPYLRAMGDIDFVVPAENVDKAKRVMQEAGYIYKSDSGGRHIEYQKDGFSFELHYHFSYVDLDLEESIEAGLRSLTSGTINDYRFPVLPTVTNGLIILAHIREHLRCGLGIRQIIDWMEFVENKLNDELWAERFFAIAKEKNLDVLAITVTRMCQIYLGLTDTVTWCSNADERLCEQLIETVMAAGNFGKNDHTQYRIGGVAINIRREGLFPYLQRIGERDWKLLKKHKWLKPFAWIRELFVFIRVAVKFRKRGDSVISNIVQSNEHRKLLMDLHLQ